ERRDLAGTASARGDVARDQRRVESRRQRDRNADGGEGEQMMQVQQAPPWTDGAPQRWYSLPPAPPTRCLLRSWPATVRCVPGAPGRDMLCRAALLAMNQTTGACDAGRR